MYTGGIFSVKNNKVSLFDVVIAADELELLEVYQQLEKRLVENKLDWRPKDIITALRYDHFTNLYNTALRLAYRNPEIIFKSVDFLKMEEIHLIRLLKCDDLELKEIKIWEYLIKWGIANTDSILNDNLTKWTPENFMDIKNTLRNCIHYIRFFQMLPIDYAKVRTQFKNILPDGLDEEVLQYFSDPNPETSFNVLKPLRGYPFDSKIINANDAALIASWVDKKQGTPYHFKELPFKFKLIYHASREGFDIMNFHKNCDNKGPTVVVIKVQNSKDIIGGYNPLEWKMEDDISIYDSFYNHKCETLNSFIFSLTNRRNPILSRIFGRSERNAIIWSKDKGPCFGLQDLWINSNSSGVCNSAFGMSRWHSYKKKIINSSREKFEIEYEVFQIIDTRFFQRWFRIFSGLIFSIFIWFTYFIYFILIFMLIIQYPCIIFIFMVFINFIFEICYYLVLFLC